MALFLERGFRTDYIIFDNVVPENYADLLPFNKRLGESQRVGDSSLALLVGIMNPLQAEVMSVRE